MAMLEGQYRRLMTVFKYLSEDPPERQVFQCTEFFATDQRLVTATLKFHMKSETMSRCDCTGFHLETERLACTLEYAVQVFSRISVLLRTLWSCGIPSRMKPLKLQRNAL